MRREWEIDASEVTDRSIYLDRRGLMKAAGLLTAASFISPALASTTRTVLTDISGKKYSNRAPGWLRHQVESAQPGAFATNEAVTPYEYVTHYNNFYEFGSAKGDPAENAQSFKTDPWKVEIIGEAGRTGTFNLEDILKPHPLEERIYRLRCVEAWSMVVPWIGFPLADLLKRFEPTSSANFVRFTTLEDPKQMPGQASRFKSIDYPYVEGLRMDEAMNELAFIAVGLYGEVLPPQNGAPLRLVIPWKYGFKSIKSIVKIEFLKRQPKTTWEITNSAEYGFYANVNPNVDHPRWSQATERRLPSSLFSPNKMDTLMFNGYAKQVASLYKGMDLKRNF